MAGDRARAARLGETITARTGGTETTGVFEGIDETGALRAMMAQRQPSMEVNQTVMLTNNQGWAQLALMEHFDGSFSEGGALNSHGLLGMRSTAILWT